MESLPKNILRCFDIGLFILALDVISRGHFSWAVIVGAAATRLVAEFFAALLMDLASWRRAAVQKRLDTGTQAWLAKVRELVEAGRAVPAFTLYLRPFEVSDGSVAQHVENFHGFSPVFESTGLEQDLAAAVAPSAPLVSMGRPSVLGGRHVTTEDTQWQLELQFLVKHARMVLVVPWSRDSVLWEIQHLVDNQLLERAVFVMAPAAYSAGHDLGRGWDDAALALREMGVNLPPYDPAGALIMCPSSGPPRRGPMALAEPASLLSTLRQLVLLPRPALRLWARLALLVGNAALLVAAAVFVHLYFEYHVWSRPVLEAECLDAKVEYCVNLGLRHARGNFGDEDPARARKAFAYACTRGEATGCFQLGNLYREGIGVDADEDRAQGYHASACKMGMKAACARGSTPGEHTPPTATERVQNTDRLLRSALSYCWNMPTACGDLGRLTEWGGEGMPQHDRVAMKLYGRGCDHDDADACRSLAQLLRHGGVFVGHPHTAPFGAWYAELRAAAASR